MGLIAKDLLDALRALAEPGDADASTFAIVSNGVRVLVATTEGSAVSVTFTTSYDANARSVPGASAKGYRESSRRALPAIRPMEIKLVRETSWHREGKASGEDFEHQTGDARFDAAFYVRTPTVDPKLLALVLDDSVRRAALELQSYGIDEIAIDDGGIVRARVAGFYSTENGPTTAETMLRAFVNLARGLPAVTATGETHEGVPLERFTSIGQACGLIGLGLAPTAFFLLAAAFDCTKDTDGGWTLTDGTIQPGLVGVVLAAALAPAATWVVSAYARAKAGPRSDTSTWLGPLRTATFLVTAEVVFVVGAALAFAILRP